MKKKLVASLAAAMVLGVAGTSFAAANPFTDVPAKHWAYDSVMKLSQAGIVDGYGDGTYKGDKLISRYEMAQMVAKAMARSDKADAAQKAQIDKLAAEFAEELNVLGVRVSALEKKVGTVKVTGDARVRYVRDDKTYAGTFADRVRINLNADVNANTSFYGRIMNQHTNEGAQETVRIADLALTSKNLFNTSATGTIGRFSQQMDPVGYFLGTTGMVDGAKVAFGNQLKVTVGMADFTQTTNGSAPTTNTLATTLTRTAGADTILGTVDDVWTAATTSTAPAPKIETAAFVTADYKTSKVTTLSGAYLTETTSAGTENDFKVWIAGFKTTIAPNVGLIGEYMKNTAAPGTIDPKGYVARLTYKGVDAKKPGSFGALVECYKFENGMLPSGGNGNVSDFATYNIVNLQNNKKATDVIVNYALSKNIILDAVQTFGTKVASTGVASSNYTRFNVNYMF